ncbi:DUF4232 domain-containing protein [Streptomyces sp. NPDC002138]|uniref:DUF4232 domain-containing protein n=1 Tax=Streptomyces sp. NPDC002138 TaxID=3154410 RepID=UPI003330404A
MTGNVGRGMAGWQWWGRGVVLAVGIVGVLGGGLVGCDTPPPPAAAPGPTGRPVLEVPRPGGTPTGPGPEGATRRPDRGPTDVPPPEADPGGACPEGGVRITEEPGDAAMGLRAGGLRLVNCSAEPYRLDGYPELRVLDAQARPVQVAVVHGADGITTGVPNVDRPPQPVTLMPGDPAVFPLLWRNTVTDGPAVEGWYVEVVPRPGAAPVRLRLVESLDLGTTGKLAIGPWQTPRTAP